MLSKRQYKRNIKKIKENILNVNQTSTQLEHNATSTATISKNTFVLPQRENIVTTQNVDELRETEIGPLHSHETLSEKLRKWFLEHKPTTECTTDLLKILKSENLKVPTSVQGLVGKYTLCNERTTTPGKYVHIGLINQLCKITCLLEELQLEEVSEDIGIDGLPIFKSSAVGLWPILARFVNIPQCSVFMIGCYVGKQKPADVNNYLHDFAAELMELKNNGFDCNGKRINIKIRAFVCDAPAKAFVCGIKGHMSLNGCSWCRQIGVRIDNVNTFSTYIGEKRTNEDFQQRTFKDFHKPMYLELQMKLEVVGIKMMTQFPLDAMHLIDLGITKKILSAIINKKTINQVNQSSIQQISEKLMSLSKHIPREFSRKPRALSEIGRWKATEFRQFILSAYRILIGSSSSSDIEKADNMIKEFVETFPVLYGRASVTYNVHNLLHLVDCVKEFGNLDSFSAYGFENYIQKIKRSIKMPKHLTQQIHNIFFEETIILPTLFEGLKIKNGTIKSLVNSKGYFSCSSPDNVCLMVNKKFVKITSILNKEQFIAKTFLNPQNFFNSPLNSMDLNIAFAKNEFSTRITFYIKDIFAKVVELPYINGCVLIPEPHDYVVAHQITSPKCRNQKNKSLTAQSIQEDVKEIKSTILQSNNNDSTQQNLLLDKLSNQNINVSNILAEQTRFPVGSEDELKEWENDNKCGMIHAVKCLLGKGGIRKNLKLILSPHLILSYNLHGTHNKKRLYSYNKVMDVLLRSTVNPNDSHSFESDMRKAIKDIKNRYFKDQCVKKKEQNTAKDIPTN
ncbi:hypothetical protein CVS40_4497 [Lucilia cuprina]|nr:hypothetical protein CVS40_4497 [Lucilia cuprina]